jgi:hypothetical protein
MTARHAAVVSKADAEVAKAEAREAIAASKEATAAAMEATAVANLSKAAKKRAIRLATKKTVEAEAKEEKDAMGDGAFAAGV